MDNGKIQVDDILLQDGKPYVSLRMYKDLQNKLEMVQETAEYFLQRLTAIEVANEHRRNMAISIPPSHRHYNKNL
ncbi:MAG: hypothetical protein EGQ20_16250 [Bacteroides oleiciplenus]|nr:hypothetical protein [Bacteroides oleiciplenus]